MDGTRSKGMAAFLKMLVERFKDVSYALKTLPDGKQVVDGKLMSWVYKLKNINNDNPITTFYRDLKLLEKGLKINKTAAALNYWLLYDITDLPLGISKLSYDSYTVGVAPDGTLPVKLFGRSLNFKRIKEKNIHWLICAAEKDDLVEKESALAPLDWVDAEVSMFKPRAMATSWSHHLRMFPHSCFGIAVVPRALPVGSGGGHEKPGDSWPPMEPQLWRQPTNRLNLQHRLPNCLNLQRRLPNRLNL
jgi:hypothetical protein